MAPEDSKAPFMRIPWAAALLKRPNTICRVPNSRIPKSDGEDSLTSGTFKTARTLRSCISFYQLPPSSQENIEEIHTLFTLGDGLNGHPDILHGGIVATLLDESMGILQFANHDRKHLAAVGKGVEEGDMPRYGVGMYTAELNIKYKRPVQTPGAVLVTSRYIKREGRKEWIYAEVKQREGANEDYDGDEVVCATAKSLFVIPKSKL